MATAGLNRITLWGDLEGRQLEQRWLLGRLVQPEGRTAWFEAIGPDGVPVMLSITEALNDEEDLLARLRAAAGIRHRHVVAIREAVISHLDDTPVVVAAMEMTEENLGDVLRERLLSAAEGRQVLDAVLAALGAIHAHGLVHRHVEASSVVAMGDTIKLRSDCLSMSSGSAFGMGTADDVRWAARMVTHAVTGRFPAGENDPILQLLPESMARAVRRALTGASATEVAALAGTRLELMKEIPRDAKRIEPLSKIVARTPVTAPEVMLPVQNGPAPGMPVPTIQAATAMRMEKPEAGPMATKGSLAEALHATPRVVPLRPADVQAQARLFADPLMLPNERELGDLRRATQEAEAEEGRWPRASYIIAAAVAVVLVTVLTLLGMMRTSSKADQPAARQKTMAVASSPAKPAASATAPTAVIPVTEPSAGWRVVAYTYNYENAAVERAKAVAAQFPQLQPGVLELKSAEAWLVTLGGAMSRDEALSLREKAIQMGLPEDTYAHNFR